ncbi:MAG: response regulator [Deltaproteobacteria bacterium]|nr:response regulator [Deltaproteobacteria bacterium]MBW2075121.1 response regulator [Deltaproteobacteria bacterium]
MTEKRKRTPEQFTILIADRNPHVREFLRRELMAEGYRVLVANDGREVLRMTDVDEPPELLILDLDMPYVSGLTVLEQLQKRKSPLPVMIHTFRTEYAKHPAVQRAAGFWEKRGDNIDGFKATVSQLLRKCYPHRFLSRIATRMQRREHGFDGE